MNNPTTEVFWEDKIMDPTGRRENKPRQRGRTMIIDKGIGLRAFEDLLETAGEYIDMIKLGFGTAALYPREVLQKKIHLAQSANTCIFPGGTYLERAVHQQMADSFLKTASELGFTGIEVSDGTTTLSRSRRSELIIQGLDYGFSVFTEYGKKGWGSSIQLEELIETVMIDMEMGAELVTIEARESGVGVGIFDEKGICKDNELEQVLAALPRSDILLWEAPQKDQQVHLLKMLGPDIHLGNIPPQEVIPLETLRRGLRSDTFFQAEIWRAIEGSVVHEN